MAAHYWFVAVEEGDFGRVWAGVDPTFRVVLAQAWLWANREISEVASHDPEEAAEALASDAPGHELSDDFVDTTLDKFQTAWPWLHTDHLAAASAPRVVAPDYEAIVLTPTLEGDQGYVVNGPTLIEPALRVLMHRVDGRWLVAGFYTDEFPFPSWPPRDRDTDA
jgi:hypothetical protein